VGKPGDQLATSRARRARRPALAHAQERQRGCGREEGGGVEAGHRGAAEPREQSGAGQRRQQPQALAQGLDRGVAVSDQRAGEHLDQQRRLAGAQHHR
jgi:hypothetical protein